MANLTDLEFVSMRYSPRWLQDAAKSPSTTLHAPINYSNATILNSEPELVVTTLPLNGESVVGEEVSEHGSGIAISVCILALSLLIVCGNALVIHTVRVEKSLHTVGNCFIVSLAISDLLVGLFALPFNIFVYLPVTSFGFESTSLKYSLRDVWIAADYLFSSATILNQVMLNLDRFWSITSPIRYMRKRTKRRALLQVLATWAFITVWVLIPAIGWRTFFPGVIQTDRAHFVNFDGSAWLMAASSIVIFFIPLFIMFGIYIRIFVEIHRRSKLAVGRSSIGSTMSRKTSELPGLTAQDLEKLRAIYRNTRHKGDEVAVNGMVRYDVNTKMVRCYSSINEEISEEEVANEKQGATRSAKEEVVDSERRHSKTKGGNNEMENSNYGASVNSDIEVSQTDKLTDLEDDIQQYNVTNDIMSQLPLIPDIQIFNKAPERCNVQIPDTNEIESDSGPIVITVPEGKNDDEIADEGICDDDDEDDDDVFTCEQSALPGDITVYFRPVHRRCPQRTQLTMPFKEKNCSVWVPRVANGTAKKNTSLNGILKEHGKESPRCHKSVCTFSRSVKSETNLLEMKNRLRAESNSSPEDGSMDSVISSISRNTQRPRWKFRSYSHPKLLDSRGRRKESTGGAAHAKLRSVSFSRSSFSSSFSGSTVGRGSSARLQLSQQAKAAKQLGIIMACFLLCWLPYFIQVVIIAICPHWYNLSALQVAVYLGYLNSLCNTFLYAMCNAKFRKSLKNKLLSSCCRKRKSLPLLPPML